MSPVPTYVEHARVDVPLRAAAAVRGGDPLLITVKGPSKVGKSRALLRRYISCAHGRRRVGAVGVDELARCRTGARVRVPGPGAADASAVEGLHVQARWERVGG